MQVPINDKERLYIEYRPKLGYKVDILAIVDSLGLEEGSQVPLPVELQEALANPAASVIETGLETVNEMDTLLDVLEDKLLGTTGGGVSFEDYLTAIKEGDHETQAAWDDHHRNSMDGKTEAELYPLLLASRNSLASALEFLNKESFRVNPSEDTSEGSAFNGQNRTIPDTASMTNVGAQLFGDYTSASPIIDTSIVPGVGNLQAIKDLEASQLEAVVRSQVEKGTVPSQTLANLKAKTEIVNIISELIEVKQEFTQGVGMLANQSMEDAIGGDAANVVENLATMSQAAASGAGAMLTIVHAAKAGEMADLSERMEKLAGQSVRDIVQDEITELRKLVDKAHETMNWMESVDTNFEQSAIATTIDEGLVGITMTVDGYESAMLDLFKMNNMEQIQSADILDALSSKDTTRRTYQVLTDMKQHYTPSQRPDLAAQQFADNMGYASNRVTKVKAKALTNDSLDRNNRR